MRLLFPEGFRLVVVVKNGDPELVNRQLHVFGEKRPGKVDRVFFKIVAKGEIA